MADAYISTQFKNGKELDEALLAALAAPGNAQKAEIARAAAEEAAQSIMLQSELLFSLNRMTARVLRGHADPAESITINDGDDAPVINIQILGNSIQNGTPTAASPVDIQSAELGSLVLNDVATDLSAVDELRRINAEAPGITGYTVRDSVECVDGVWCHVRRIRRIYLEGCTFNFAASYVSVYENGTSVTGGALSYICPSSHFVSRKRTGEQTAGTWYGTRLVIGSAVLPEGVTDNAAMVAWVNAEVAAGRPPYIDFALADPVVTALSDDLQAQLNALRTVTGNNTLTAVPAGTVTLDVALEYARSLNITIENLVNAVTALSAG